MTRRAVRGGIFRESIECDGPFARTAISIWFSLPLFFGPAPMPLEAACAKIGGKSCGGNHERVKILGAGLHPVRRTESKIVETR